MRNQRLIGEILSAVAIVMLCGYLNAPPNAYVYCKNNNPEVIEFMVTSVLWSLGLRLFK
jgi:hypothetical protein